MVTSNALNIFRVIPKASYRKIIYFCKMRMVKYDTKKDMRKKIQVS